MRMIAKLISIVIVAAGFAVVSPTAAHADSVGFVHQAEFRQVRKGMSIRRAHRIFDTGGKQSMYFPAYPSINSPAEQTREYRTKSRWGSVNVTYVKRAGVWRVKSKYAYWG
jgi:hypothetical protein